MIFLGPFRIYRTPGSVAFLNCGSALQPIFPKSQCWCLDEHNSRFVLQIRRPNYWRIELPVSNPEDQRQAQLLRGVLDQVLQFEKTECPFKRAFTVTLPERPQTPTKKKPWTPALRPQSGRDVERPDSPLSQPSSVKSINPAKPIWGENGAAVRLRSLSIKSASGLPRHLEGNNDDIPHFTKTQDELEERQMSRTEEPVNVSLTVSEFEKALADTVEEKCARRSTISQDELTKNNFVMIPQESVHVPESKQAPQCTELPTALEKTCFEPGNGPLYSSAVLPCHDMELTSEKNKKQEPSSDVDGTVYEVHEGEGNQGGARKTRLRRGIGRCVARSVSTPHLRQSKESRSHLAVPPVPAVPPMPPVPPMPIMPVRPDAPTAPPALDRPANPVRSTSPNGSQDSFHSIDSWHSSNGQFSPSPLTSHLESPITKSDSHHEPRRTQHTAGDDEDRQAAFSQNQQSCDVLSMDRFEDSRESMVTAPEVSISPANETPLTSIVSESDSGVSTAFLGHRPSISHQATTGSISVRRRTLSPLPPAVNLFSTSTPEQRPPTRSRLETVKQLPMAIINKTCEIILGPPSHIIALMLKVAARIAAGQWRGIVYGYGEDGQAIPVQWDYSEGEFSDWSDDEPYMGPRHRRHSVANHKAKTRVDKHNAADERGIWGVD